MDEEMIWSDSPSSLMYRLSELPDMIVRGSKMTRIKLKDGLCGGPGHVARVCPHC